MQSFRRLLNPEFRRQVRSVWDGVPIAPARCKHIWYYDSVVVTICLQLFLLYPGMTLLNPFVVFL
jgi:hypothetical protein